MALMNEGTPAEAADEQSELFVTMDFAGECWDVWFPNPLGGRPRRRGQAGDGDPAQGRRLRVASAQGTLRGKPEGGHGELDRLLPQLKRGMWGRR